MDRCILWESGCCVDVDHGISWCILYIYNIVRVEIWPCVWWASQTMAIDMVILYKGLITTCSFMNAGMMQIRSCRWFWFIPIAWWANTMSCRWSTQVKYELKLNLYILIVGINTRSINYKALRMAFIASSVWHEQAHLHCPSIYVSD